MFYTCWCWFYSLISLFLRWLSCFPSCIILIISLILRNLFSAITLSIDLCTVVGQCNIYWTVSLSVEVRCWLVFMCCVFFVLLCVVLWYGICSVGIGFPSRDNEIILIVILRHWWNHCSWWTMMSLSASESQTHVQCVERNITVRNIRKQCTHGDHHAWPFEMWSVESFSISVHKWKKWNKSTLTVKYLTLSDWCCSVQYGVWI